MINKDLLKARTQSDHGEAESVDESRSNRSDSQRKRTVRFNIGNEQEHLNGLQGNAMSGDFGRGGTGAKHPNQNAFGNNNVAGSNFGPGNGRGGGRRGSSRRSRGRSRSSSVSGDLNRQSDAIFNSAVGSSERATGRMDQRWTRRRSNRGSRDTQMNNGNGNYYYYRRQLGMRGRGSGNGRAMNSRFGQQRVTQSVGSVQSTVGTNRMAGSNMFEEWYRRGRGGSGKPNAFDMSGTRPASNAQTNPWSVNRNNGQFGLGNVHRNSFDGGRRQQQRNMSHPNDSQFVSRRRNMPFK